MGLPLLETDTVRAIAILVAATLGMSANCAPDKSPHHIEDISYYGWGLQAKTAMTHQLHSVFHDAQRRARSVS